MTEKGREALAYRHGMLRKRHGLSPYEAALCTLWLLGVEGQRLDGMAREMLVWKSGFKARRKAQKRQKKSITEGERSGYVQTDDQEDPVS